ncbi:MAG: hypothetical protein EOO20_28740, partial [Chryseobacterium sp.]
LLVALRGAYSGLRAVDIFGRTIPVIGDVYADNAYQSSQNGNRYTLFNSYLLTVNDANVVGFWTSAYTAILRANNIINSTVETSANVDQYKVFFVSDDIEYVKAFFKEKPNYIYSNNDEITDFQIIQHSDIAIISNSSFAWWAAYLSPKKNTVYGPKNWLGFRIGKEHPKRVMTDRFTWCEVLS